MCTTKERSDCSYMSDLGVISVRLKVWIFKRLIYKLFYQYKVAISHKSFSNINIFSC